MNLTALMLSCLPTKCLVKFASMAPMLSTLREKLILNSIEALGIKGLLTPEVAEVLFYWTDGVLCTYQSSAVTALLRVGVSKKEVGNRLLKLLDPRYCLRVTWVETMANNNLLDADTIKIVMAHCRNSDKGMMGSLDEIAQLFHAATVSCSAPDDALINIITTQCDLLGKQGSWRLLSAINSKNSLSMLTAALYRSFTSGQADADALAPVTHTDYHDFMREINAFGCSNRNNFFDNFVETIPSSVDTMHQEMVDSRICSALDAVLTQLEPLDAEQINALVKISEKIEEVTRHADIGPEEGYQKCPVEFTSRLVHICHIYRDLNFKEHTLQFIVNSLLTKRYGFGTSKFSEAVQVISRSDQKIAVEAFMKLLELASDEKEVWASIHQDADVAMLRPSWYVETGGGVGVLCIVIEYLTNNRVMRAVPYFELLSKKFSPIVSEYYHGYDDGMTTRTGYVDNPMCQLVNRSILKLKS